MIINMLYADIHNGKLMHGYIMNYGTLEQCELARYRINEPTRIRFYPNNKSIRWDDVRFFDANWSEAMTIEELKEYYEG